MFHNSPGSNHLSLNPLDFPAIYYRFFLPPTTHHLLPNSSCHPERGRAPARFLQGGKPESKDLGFRHTTIAKIPLETPVAPAYPHQPLSFGGAGLQPCHQPQKKPVASTPAAPRNPRDRNPPCPSPAP